MVRGVTQLQRLSAYVRPEDGLATQTTHGAVVTMLGAALAVVLFVNEVAYFSTARVTRMSVDLARRHDLPINLDISFPAVPCAVLSIDVLDMSGTLESDSAMSTDIQLHKRRVDKDGKQIGRAEYVTPQSEHVLRDSFGGVVNVNVNEARKHLIDMEAEDKEHEGCRLTGRVTVRRVAGRVHIACHQGALWQLMPQLMGDHKLPRISNLSHTIHDVSFGPAFKGRVSPLAGMRRTVGDGPDADAFKYYLKVVPTEYYGRWGGVTETHQYSVSEYVSRAKKFPVPGEEPAALDLFYDVSPIVVTVSDSPRTTAHFLVRLCAVVGGVFAVTRMTDRWVDWIVKCLTKR